ncbi:MAG: FAD-dependent monooxygenase, partial [Ktedonobacteraceae bacterium]
MRVLISGGGIAGMTLAYWLERYGMQPVVIEQAASIRHDGYGIDFFGTGYDVAERMDIIERLKPHQIPMNEITYVNRHGKTSSTLSIDLMKIIMRGKYMPLIHSILPEALYETLAGRVEVRFGRMLSTVQQDEKQVEVTFNDGTRESFDLLIGADGVHSLTRKLVFGPEEQFSRYLGYTVACYPLQDRYKIGNAWKMYAEPGRVSGAYNAGSPGELITLFVSESATRERVHQEQRLAHLRQVFAHMGWITQQMLADTPASTPIFMDAVAQIQMPTWRQGRVALVGDACGCPTLLSGQGASLAMGGAYLLAEALHETPDYQEAFRGYEQFLKPHVQGQQ